MSAEKSIDSLPHCWRLVTVLLPGVCIQLVEIDLVPMLLQMLPSVQAEKVSSVEDVVGFIIYCPPALQVEVVKGQQ
jgi:hypothetical protein